MTQSAEATITEFCEVVNIGEYTASALRPMTRTVLDVVSRQQQVPPNLRRQFYAAAATAGTAVGDPLMTAEFRRRLEFLPR